MTNANKNKAELLADKQLVRHAREWLKVCIRLNRESYIDPETMRAARWQTFEWLGFCMESACIAQQLYAEKMGWAK